MPSPRCFSVHVRVQWVSRMMLAATLPPKSANALVARRAVGFMKERGRQRRSNSEDGTGSGDHVDRGGQGGCEKLWCVCV